MFNGKQYATRLWSELIDTFGNRGPDGKAF